MNYLQRLKQNKDEILFILGLLYMGEEFTHTGEHETNELITKLQDLTGKSLINIDELELDLLEV